jgi:N-acetylmuramoyl-L-alanine amidase
MRFIISVGHDSKNQGAKANELIEYELNEKVVAIVEAEFAKRFSEHELIVLNNVSGKDRLAQAIKAVNAAHTESPVDLAIEVHFNAAENTNWHGCEVLYGSKRGYHYAHFLNERFVALLGEKYRRIFNPLDELRASVNDFAKDGTPRKTSGQIKGFLHKTKPVCLISEAGFISHAPTAAKLKKKEKLQAVAEAHLDLFEHIILTKEK